MAISAKQVKELREKTGAGMMDCKKALTETDGDIEKAVDWLREKGIAKSVKKAGRIAAEGLTRVVTNGNTGVVVEVNSETDFVTKNDQFLALVDTIANAVLENKPATNEEVLAISTPEGTIEELITNATATIGEKISFRRFALVEKADDEQFGSYMHMGGSISVLVLLKGANEEVAKDMAMQVASMSPLYISQKDVPAEDVERETALQRQIMADDEKLAGKPEKVLAGILNGKVSKHFKEMCLMDQEYFKDPKEKVSNYLKNNKAEVVSFVRFKAGEGIEKKEDNFAEEVMAQVNA
jgi:elongation factor Ts